MLRKCLSSASVLGILFVAKMAAAQCDGHPREIFNETYEIDRQVDPVRNVQRAVVRNTTRGDWVVEFMSVRTDLPDTSERWIVTYECDDEFDFVQHVEVDGVWQYTMTYANALGDPQVSLAVHGDSAVINVGDGCQCNANFSAFQAIATEEIASSRPPSLFAKL